MGRDNVISVLTAFYGAQVRRLSQTITARLATALRRGGDNERFRFVLSTYYHDHTSDLSAVIVLQAAY